jgi:hypothetical protein
MPNDPQLTDTTPEAEAVMTELYRRMPVWKRVSGVFELGRISRGLVMEQLRKRYPNADAAELHKRYAARVLSRDEVIKAYGWDPEIEGY